jgi:hypothetical protein
MTVGDLVKAHVGNADYSGGYGAGQGWWHEYVTVVGDLKYWGESRNPKCASVEVLMSDGKITSFATQRLEVVS